MSFSQEQKEFLNFLCVSPTEAFEQIKNGDIDLSTYGNEYLKDGTGLLHILAEGLLTDKSSYQPLWNYVLNTGLFNVFDKKSANSDTTYDILNKKFAFFMNFNSGSENQLKEWSDALVNILQYNKNDFFEWAQGLTLLAYYKQYDAYDELYQYKPVNLNNIEASNLERVLVSQDNYPKLKQLVDDFPILKEIILQKNGSHRHNIKNKNEPYSNILVSSISHHANQCFDYFISEFNFDLSGKIDTKNYNPYTTKYDGRGRVADAKNSVDTLIQAINSNNLHAFKTLIKNRPENDTWEVLNYTLSNNNAEQKNQLVSGFERLMENTMISRKDMYLYFQHLLPEYFKNLTQEHQIQLVGSITKLPFTQIIEELEPLLPLYKNEISRTRLRHEYAIACSFLLNPKNYSEFNHQDFKNLGTIFSSLHQHNLDNFAQGTLYSPDLFINEKLFDTLLSSGMTIRYNTSSILEYYIDHYHQGVTHKLGEFHLTQKNLNIDECLKQEKTIIENIYNQFYTPEFNFQLAPPNGKYPVSSLVDKSLQKKNLIVLDLITHDYLKEVALKDNNIFFNAKSFNNAFYATRPEIQIVYENFIQKLIDIDFDFFKLPALNYTNALTHEKHVKDYPFFLLMYQNINTSLLQQIWDKSSYSMFELSQEPNFWNNVRTQGMFDFVKNNGADFESVKSLMNTLHCDDSTIFDLYVKNHGNIHYRDEQNGNILHYLVDNKLYYQAQNVLEMYPDLATHTNNQQKFSSNYAIVEFTRAIKACDTTPTHNLDEAISYRNAIDKFLNLSFSKGLVSQEKIPSNAIKSLRAQLKKYSDYEPISNLSILMEATRLENTLTKNTTKTKPSKI